MSNSPSTISRRLAESVRGMLIGLLGTSLAGLCPPTLGLGTQAVFGQSLEKTIAAVGTPADRVSTQQQQQQQQPSTPGNPTPGNPTPGNPTVGTPVQGNAVPGNATAGNATPGNATPGNATTGSREAENAGAHGAITSRREEPPLNQVAPDGRRTLERLPAPQPGYGWRNSERDAVRSRGESRRSGGMVVNSPVLPTMDPRPGVGAGVDEQWSRVRPESDNESMGGFSGPLQGPDATLELVLGQGRLLTLKRPIFRGPRDALIAVGDPTIVDFELLPNPQLIRLIARRAGVTDLTITGADSKTFSFEVRVLYDLPLMEAHLRQLFPDALVKLSQIREHLVVEGQARSPQQVGQIVEVLEAILISLASGTAGGSSGGGMANNALPAPSNGQAMDPYGSGASPALDGAPNATPPTNGLPGVDSGGAGVGDGDGDGDAEGDGPDMEPADDEAAGILRQRTPARLASSQAQGPPASPTTPDMRGLSTGDITVPGLSWGSGGSRGRGRSMRGRLINLLTVPGSQQVMLNVRIAELNRTAMRRIGADIVSNFGSGGVLNTRMSGSTTSAASDAASAASTLFRLSPTSGTTAVAIVPGGGFDLALTALRQNSVVSILAEPNLIAYSGQQASFLAGGEFPVPVPQNTGTGVSNVGLQYKEFGVKLNFTPVVLTEETIRLRVSPEASTIDLSTGTSIGGTAVPGINTRRVDTTVELGQGQTLVLAGLLSVSMDAQTSRIPGLGDLPYLGPLFSNTSHQRVEKELLVLVTPYLVRPLNPEQLPPMPGCEIQEPNDLEFFFLNRIEGRTGRPFRSTVAWDDPWNLRHTLRFESHNVCGPIGFSDFSNKPLVDSPLPQRQTAAQPSSRR